MQVQNKTRKGQERAEEILDAATEILVSVGHSGFSMRGVADHLCTRLSNVQYYFKSPGDLVHALFDRTIQRAIQTFEARSAEDGIKDAVNFVLDEYKSKEANLVFWELWALAARSNDINEVLKHFYGQYRIYIQDILQRSNPDLTLAVCKRRAIIIISLLEGLSLFLGTGDRIDVSRTRLDKEIIDAVRCIAMQG
jgi:AcrR family transcriptional regulator